MPGETFQSGWERLIAGNPAFPGAPAAGEWLRSKGYWQTGLPDITDERVLLTQYARKRQLAAMRGRTSTFLTGPRGIGPGLPTSDMARAFLLADIEGPGQPPAVGTEARSRTSLAPPGAAGGPAGSAPPAGKGSPTWSPSPAAVPGSTSLSRLFSGAAGGRLW